MVVTSLCYCLEWAYDVRHVADDDAIIEVSKSSSNEKNNDSLPPHAFTIAAILTSLGQLLNTKLLYNTLRLISKSSSSNAGPLSLSLPVTTLHTRS